MQFASFENDRLNSAFKSRIIFFLKKFLLFPHETTINPRTVFLSNARTWNDPMLTHPQLGRLLVIYRNPGLKAKQNTFYSRWWTSRNRNRTSRAIVEQVITSRLRKQMFAHHFIFLSHHNLERSESAPDRRLSRIIGTSPVATGVWWAKPSQINIWNTINQLNFCQILMSSPPART